MKGEGPPRGAVHGSEGAFPVPLHLPAHAGWCPNLNPERTTWKQPPDRGEQWEKKTGVKMLEEELGTESLTYAFPPTGPPLRKHPYHRSRVM